MKNNKKGFTLIEVLIVVVIVGLLANMATANFKGKTDEAREVSDKASMVNIMTALELYEMDKGKYPDDGGENPLAILLGKNSEETIYLKIDESELERYEYALSKDKKSYTIDIKKED